MAKDNKEKETRAAAPARRESSALVPWGGDPFGIVRRFAEEMDRLFEDFGFRRGLMAPWPISRWSGLGADLTTWSPALEVFRRDDRLVIRADLPGLTKDDVKVEVTDDTVTIRGERRQEQEERRAGYYHSERSYGYFCRSIPLPEGAEADKAEANFRDGVLEITMPAPAEASRGRLIEVKG